MKKTEFVDLETSLCDSSGEQEQDSEEDAVTSGAYINFVQVVGTHDFNDLVHNSDSNKIMKAMKSIIMKKEEVAAAMVHVSSWLCQQDGTSKIQILKSSQKPKVQMEIK